MACAPRTDGKHDATKTHVEAAMSETARPAMRALSDVVDTWERFANALSPTPPFSPRLRLAAVVRSLVVAMTIVASALFVKATTVGVGFAMFGQPIMTRSVHWITTRHPNWREALELRKYVHDAGL
ncbi:uncharacterized protein LAESUDRAFT_815547 [Laetiporus sulphureus 93-53]|uniref:Uncharacterized protein n=1 Tax=Laetiporus sulphureus 93-53 TaxID=1314785 RepID=A0A165C2Y5_9APHY|nr:uncharacterized protein LAESUDRAFT_815547 [Laetiporus sulphureus 93-53]KZT02106.1 hypothetical protein LAESUDRAFT_815547 [Laetiporus sulphureus 93-53]